MEQRIVPNLWFDGRAEEAATYYCSVFDDARILATTRAGDDGPGEPGAAITVEFELEGMRFVAINGGPQHPFDEAVSFAITCDTQEELDRYWAALTDGGEESQCGWCKDRFGLSWQVLPAGLGDLLADPDPDRAGRAMQALLGMRKLDIAAIAAAADGEG